MNGSGSDLFVALDVGTAKIGCLIAEDDGNGVPHVLGVGHKLSRGLRSGAVIDIDARRGLRRQIREFSLHHTLVGLLELRGSLGETKVDQLHLTILRHQDVRRRDVAVNDAERLEGLGVFEIVRVLKSLARLDHYVQRLWNGDAPVLLIKVVEDGFEIATVDELHDQEVGVG